MLVSDELHAAVAGRTTTALDDRLIRAVGSLHPAAAGLLALTVYATWGLAIPLLLGSDTAWFLSFNTEGAVFAGAIIFALLFPVIEARLRRQRLELTTDLRQLSAREFEELVGEMFRLEGWNVIETGGHGRPDGGIDLRLKRGSDSRLVQCKRWTSWSVDVEEIRKLGGTLLAEGLPGTSGVLVTSSDFTQAATETAKQLRLEIIDGVQLVHRLEAAGATGLLGPLRRSHSRWLCPHCAAPMVLDQSSHGWWLRCPAYRTGCKGKRDLGADPQHALELLRATT